MVFGATFFLFAGLSTIVHGHPVQESAPSTFYSAIPNLAAACVTAPNVPRVNYVANPPMRKDVTDGQPGVSFTLDIGIVNTATCQPLSDVLVELWSANAKGQYGSYLRGATTTASNGIAEFQTIFPGYTSDGANHFSIAVHQTSSMSSPILHTGQLFFTDPWTNIVSMSADYQGNSNTRILNRQDSSFITANSGGYSAVVNILSIHDDWPEGVIGDIAVGINPSSSA